MPMSRSHPRAATALMFAGAAFLVLGATMLIVAASMFVMPTGASPWVDALGKVCFYGTLPSGVMGLLLLMGGDKLRDQR